MSNLSTQFENPEIIEKIECRFKTEELHKLLKAGYCSRRFGYKIYWPEFLRIFKADESMKNADASDPKKWLAEAKKFVKKFGPAKCKKLIKLRDPSDRGSKGEFKPENCYVEIAIRGWSNFFHESLEWGNSAKESDDQAQTDLGEQICGMFGSYETSNGERVSDYLNEDSVVEFEPDATYCESDDFYNNDFRYMYRVLENE